MRSNTELLTGIFGIKAHLWPCQVIHGTSTTKVQSCSFWKMDITHV